MHSKDEKWVITFNGCIYNFKELKSDLESHGHKYLLQLLTLNLFQRVFQDMELIL